MGRASTLAWPPSCSSDSVAAVRAVKDRGWVSPSFAPSRKRSAAPFESKKQPSVRASASGCRACLWPKRRTQGGRVSSVLLVEDDERVRRFIVRGLEGEGHAVSIAGDGSRGLAAAREGEFDA